MTLWVKDAGSWKQPIVVWVKDSGTWKRIYALWVKDGGSWKKVFPIAGSVTLTSDTSWTVPNYETITVKCYGGGGGGGGGGANEGFSYGSWGGQGGFGGQTSFGSSTPLIGYGGIGGQGGGDLGQGPTNGDPGGGQYSPTTWGLCRPGASTPGAPAGIVGGHPLYWPLLPGPTPSTISIPGGIITADGGAAGGAAGAGSGNGGTVGGNGGNGGYVEKTWNVRDAGAPAPQSSISVVVGKGGGRGDRAYDSGAQGQYGQPGGDGSVVISWS